MLKRPACWRLWAPPADGCGLGVVPAVVVVGLPVGTLLLLLPVGVVLGEEETEEAEVGATAKLEPEAGALEEPLLADELELPLPLEAATKGPKTPPC
jgi:hypothetical protein